MRDLSKTPLSVRVSHSRVLEAFSYENLSDKRGLAGLAVRMDPLTAACRASPPAPFVRAAAELALQQPPRPLQHLRAAAPRVVGGQEVVADPQRQRHEAPRLHLGLVAAQRT